MLTLLAAFSIGALAPLIIKLVLVGLCCWLLWWLIGFIALPEPFNKVARVLVALVAVIYLITILESLA